MSDEKQEPKYVSLEDIPEDEVTGLDPEADPFAAPPPPEEGVHVMKVSFLDPTRPFISKEVDGRFSHIAIPLKGKVEDEGYSKGRVCFDRMVTTKPNQNGASRVAGIIRALGERPDRGHKGQAEQLMRLIGPEGALLKVKGIWVARQAEPNGDGGAWDEKWKLKGMKQFPQMENGHHNHVVKSGYDGTDVAAGFDVQEYKPLN